MCIYISISPKLRNESKNLAFSYSYEWWYVCPHLHTLFSSRAITITSHYLERLVIYAFYLFLFVFCLFICVFYLFICVFYLLYLFSMCVFYLWFPTFYSPLYLCFLPLNLCFLPLYLCVLPPYLFSTSFYSCFLPLFMFSTSFHVSTSNYVFYLYFCFLPLCVISVYSVNFWQRFSFSLHLVLSCQCNPSCPGQGFNLIPTWLSVRC